MTEDAIRVTAGRPVERRRATGRDLLRLPTELVVLALVSVAVLVAAAFADDLDAGRAWTLVTVLAAAYIVSRGLAKLGRGAGDGL